MIRTGFLLLLIGSAVAGEANAPSMKWPLRASVTDLHGKPVAFQAVTLGGDLIIQVGQRSALGDYRLDRRGPELDPLPHGDTLRANTPAAYPLDLARGPVVFFTRGQDSIRVAIGRSPSGRIALVTAAGRRLTVRLLNAQVVIDSK